MSGSAAPIRDTSEESLVVLLESPLSYLPHSNWDTALHSEPGPGPAPLHNTADITLQTPGQVRPVASAPWSPGPVASVPAWRQPPLTTPLQLVLAVLEVTTAAHTTSQHQHQQTSCKKSRLHSAASLGQHAAAGADTRLWVKMSWASSILAPLTWEPVSNNGLDQCWRANYPWYRAAQRRQVASSSSCWSGSQK